MFSFLLESRTFSIFGVTISFYGLIIAIAMILGISVAFLICNVKNFDKNMPINVALFAIPLAKIGARIYYCAFNGVYSFLQIFKIWEGGMAIYGGIIGGFIGVMISSKVNHYSLFDCLDLAAPCLIIGQAIGRIGCYFAGCCYGIATDIEALQVFPISVLIAGKWHLATFFYEAILNLFGFIILMIITKKSTKRGIALSSYLIIYGFIRAILEGLRDPSESLMFFSTGIKVSQALSVLSLILGIVMLCIILNKRAKKEQE